MGFFNTSNTIGLILSNATDTLTGDLFITLLVIFIILIALALMFQIPLLFTTIILLPLMLGYMAFVSEFLAMGIVMLIYLAMVIAQTFFIR